MSKELKKELFNIYDVVVFEDEKGITQDCVCSIGKDKEVDEIECNNHDISIYENGSYKVWEKNGKNLPYYATNKKIIHLYTLKNDNRFYEIYPTDDYKVIENATNFSEALEQVKFFKEQDFYDEIGQHYGFIKERCKVIEEALLELKAIKEAEPSEALKCFDKIYNTINLNWNNDLLRVGIDIYNRSDCDDGKEMTNCLDTIKQALIKAHEQDRVLKIIKEKNVDILAIKESKTLEEYNRNAWETEHYGNCKGYRLQLVEEEFDLVKRYFENGEQEIN